MRDLVVSPAMGVSTLEPGVVWMNSSAVHGGNRCESTGVCRRGFVSRILTNSPSGVREIAWPLYVFLAQDYLYSFSVFFPYSCPKQGLYSRICQEYSSKSGLYSQIFFMFPLKIAENRFEKEYRIGRITYKGQNALSGRCVMLRAAPRARR